MSHLEQYLTVIIKQDTVWAVSVAWGCMDSNPQSAWSNKQHLIHVFLSPHLPLQLLQQKPTGKAQILYIKKNHIFKITGIKTAILSDKNRRRRIFLSWFVKLKANVGDSSYKVVPQNSSISNNFAVFCCCCLFTVSNIIPIAPASSPVLG